MAAEGRAEGAEPLPPPLPPETRTVGQLVAETIRLYGRTLLAVARARRADRDLGTLPCRRSIAGSWELLFGLTAGAIADDGLVRRRGVVAGDRAGGDAGTAFVGAASSSSSPFSGAASILFILPAVALARARRPRGAGGA